MSSFTPYFDDPSNHNIIPALKHKNKKKSALRGISNLVKNPKAALGSILKKRAASRRQKVVKEYEETLESSSESELDSSNDEDDDEEPQEQVKYIFNAPMSELSDVPDSTANGYESDGGVSHASHTSTSTTSSSASNKVRLFLNNDLGGALRGKVSSVMRDLSEFKTPRGERNGNTNEQKKTEKPVPVKPHQKKKVGFKEDGNEKEDAIPNQQDEVQYKPVEKARVEKPKVNEKEEIEKVRLKPSRNCLFIYFFSLFLSLFLTRSFQIFSKVRHGRADKVKEALLARFPVDARDEFGNTMLILSAQNNNRRILKLCLKFRANIDAVNKKGNTALHYSCFYEYTEISQTLRKYGARCDIKNHEGNICFVMAAAAK